MMSDTEVFDLVDINEHILKSASPEAKKIITENQLWFSHLYFTFIKNRESDTYGILQEFWTPNQLHSDRPKYWVPREVIRELVDICRKDYKLKH